LILRARGASYVRVSERIENSRLFNNATVIPNIVDSKILIMAPKKSDIAISQGKLLFVGRLSREKRPDLFIELARATGYRSVIIGDGQLGSHLRKISKDLVNLKFSGQQLNPWNLASRCDLLVLTSDYEGDGLVALEAISIGIPVALRATPNLQEMGFPARNYFEDIPALAARITKNHFDDFRLSDLERDLILKNRNPEEVSRLWLEYMLSHK
jgi:glycosyltransferase involved in cell wall biosynthesis